MAKATKPIDGSTWRHFLSGRNLDYSLFKIPEDYVNRWQLIDGTKRRVRISLSDGRALIGYCTITSGREVLMPGWLRPKLEDADWFECQILGNETADRASLEWE